MLTRSIYLQCRLRNCDHGDAKHILHRGCRMIGDPVRYVLDDSTTAATSSFHLKRHTVNLYSKQNKPNPTTELTVFGIFPKMCHFGYIRQLVIFVCFKEYTIAGTYNIAFYMAHSRIASSYYQRIITL